MAQAMGVSSKLINGISKVLVVVKSQRFDRMVGLNRVIFQTQTVNEDSKWQKNKAVMEALSHNQKVIELRKQNEKTFKEIQDKHFHTAESIQNSLKDVAGFDVNVKSEVDIEDADVQDVDLCISLGGDNTFLKSAAIIKNSAKTAILGINSHPERHSTKLCDDLLLMGEREKGVVALTHKLMKVGTDEEQDHVDWTVRSRIHGEKHQYHGNCPSPEEFEKRMTMAGELPPLPKPMDSCWIDNYRVEDDFVVLNEVMLSEADASVLSVYRLTIDGRDIGKFKSSGILVSTGTGSTGWLYSAKQVTPEVVAHYRVMLSQNKTQDMFPFKASEADAEIAKQISDQTIFPKNHDKMYYFVREGFQETIISEGFCSTLEFTGEMLNGEVKLDGQKLFLMKIGDKITLSLDPKYNLNCLSLKLDRPV